MTRFDPKRHGPGSREKGSPALLDAWRRADERSEFIGEDDGRCYIPAEAVWEMPGVAPRDADQETVDRYAAVFSDLPPILVRRSDFCLIDGKHRLYAAEVAASDIILARFLDCDDDALPAQAFAANLQHGRPYSLGERVKGMRALTEQEPWRSMSTTSLANLLGVHRQTVAKHRGEAEFVRTGSDGVKRAAHIAKDYVRGAPSENVQVKTHSTFDPGADREWPDEPEEDYESDSEPEYVDLETGEIQASSGPGRVVDDITTDPSPAIIQAASAGPVEADTTLASGMVDSGPANDLFAILEGLLRAEIERADIENWRGFPGIADLAIAPGLSGFAHLVQLAGGVIDELLEAIEEAEVTA